MKNYRIVKDNHLGYEAQVRYAWFPFIWFQMNDFYWINTWTSEEQARRFIEHKKYGRKLSQADNEADFERTAFEKEVKLLIFQPKNLRPEIVWLDNSADKKLEEKSRRWWPIPAFNG